MIKKRRPRTSFFVPEIQKIKVLASGMAQHVQEARQAQPDRSTPWVSHGQDGSELKQV
jgi:hypothetical protein